MQPKALDQVTPERRSEPTKAESRHHKPSRARSASAADKQRQEDRQQASANSASQSISQVPRLDPSHQGPVSVTLTALAVCFQSMQMSPQDAVYADSALAGFYASPGRCAASESSRR